MNKITVRAIFLFSCLFFYLLMEIGTSISRSIAISGGMTRQEFDEWDNLNSTGFETVTAIIVVAVIVYLISWLVAEFWPDTKFAELFDWVHGYSKLP